MTSYYQILGRKVPAYQLSIATFATVFAGVGYAVAKPKKAAAPQIQAESSEEEKYILNFLKEQEVEAAKAQQAKH